jgi:hypothetical protein
MDRLAGERIAEEVSDRSIDRAIRVPIVLHLKEDAAEELVSVAAIDIQGKVDRLQNTGPGEVGQLDLAMRFEVREVRVGIMVPEAVLQK